MLPRPLPERDLTLVATLQLARSGDVARIFAAAGFDALVLDCEHNAISGDSLGEICIAALESDLLPLVRLPDGAAGPIRQALSCGALGIVVPRMERPEEARAIVAVTRFPPAGSRPVAPVFPHFRRRMLSQSDAVDALSRHTCLVAIIETEAGIARAEEIAAVSGIDVLFVGMSDLSFALGTGGDKTDARLWQAADCVLRACVAHGKVPGIGAITAPSEFARARAMGFRYISAAHDATLLARAAVETASALRGMPGPAL